MTRWLREHYSYMLSVRPKDHGQEFCGWVMMMNIITPNFTSYTQSYPVPFKGEYNRNSYMVDNAFRLCQSR